MTYNMVKKQPPDSIDATIIQKPINRQEVIVMNDVDRFIHFSQFRDQIRGSQTHLIVGIDIAKDKHHAFFGTANGKTLWRRLIFTNDLIGYTRLIEQVQVLLSQYQLSEVVFGIEPTSNYHKPLAHWLINKDYLVVPKHLQIF